jgi:hypothetical protein
MPRPRNDGPPRYPYSCDPASLSEMFSMRRFP